MRQPLVVPVVVMDDPTFGLWCPDCALPSGVSVIIAIGDQLVTIVRCTECGDWTGP